MHFFSGGALLCPPLGLKGLKGFKTAAYQSWHILRVVRESNPGCAGHIDFIGLGWIPGRCKVFTNFDKLQF